VFISIKYFWKSSEHFAIIGGETHRFRPLIDLYRKAGRQAGHSAHQLKVGVHSLGYVAESTQEAVNDFFPGYARTMTEIGKEREGLISKKIYPEIPPKVEYRLIARARELGVILKDLGEWAQRWKSPRMTTTKIQ
jgi:hypothetical protein